MELSRISGSGTEQVSFDERGLAQLASGCFCRGKAASKTIENPSGAITVHFTSVYADGRKCCCIDKKTGI